MSSKEIHSNKSISKKYIIPTNEWLKPIKPFFNDDINSRSLIMLSNLVDIGKVVVKITKNIDYKKTKIINENIKSNPNMLHTFGTIKCSEAEINYNVLYKDCDGYCNKNKLETENIEIVLEIMKLYNSSLNKYFDKLNLSKIKILLKQILLCQLHIYEKIGFVHNDIHLGNILLNLIPKEKKPEILIYEIKNIKYTVETNRKLILSDFDKSIIYDQNILPLENMNYDHTIHINIIKTINTFKMLLDKNDKKKLSDSLEKALNSFSYHFITSGEKLLRSYYKRNRDYSDFISISTMECIVLLNLLWFDIYDEYLFPKYGL
jgi:hypothetical protein